MSPITAATGSTATRSSRTARSHYKQKYLPPARARHRRRRRRRRHARRPRRPALRRDADGHPGLRPGGPRELHHPHAQRQGRQPLLRRRRTFDTSSPPAATASTSGRSRSKGPTPSRPRSSPQRPGCDFRSRRNRPCTLQPIADQILVPDEDRRVWRSRRRWLSSHSAGSTARAQDSAGKDGWIPLFNGKDLDGWKPKITGYDAGRELRQYVPRGGRGLEGRPTIKYPKFDGKFGHLFYKTPVLQLPAADRVSVRRRPVPRRAELGLPQQRRHDPRPVARKHEERPGVPGLDRGPVPRRQRQGQAPHGQRLHAGHEHRDERQADHPALHRLAVQDLSTATSG